MPTFYLNEVPISTREGLNFYSPYVVTDEVGRDRVNITLDAALTRAFLNVPDLPVLLSELETIGAGTVVGRRATSSGAPHVLNLSSTSRITINIDGSDFITWDIAAQSVANSFLATMAADRIKGRANGAGTGVPQDLTPTQVRTILNVADGADNTTASNVGTAGVGVFKQKSGSDLQFKKVNAGSSKVTITDDTGSDEVDVDVVEAQINHDNLGGFVANEHVDHSSVTLTAGDGLSGGGDITTSRSFAVNVDDSTIEISSDALRVKDLGISTAKVADDAVTNAKAANMAESTIKGRAAGAGTGDPTDLTATQVRTILNVADGATAYTDEMAQDAVGAMVDASLTYVDGTPLLQRSALTGDVTASAGSNSTTIANDAVTNAKLANMATGRIKGRIDAGTSDPQDLSASQVRTIINVDDGANNYIHPDHTGDVTSFGDGATVIADDAVTYAKMQNVSATDRLLGRVSSGAGNVEEVVCTDFAQSLLDDSDAAAGRTTLGLGALATGASAADVPYTPAVDTDWDGDADPGNVDDALDQLAERVDDLEGAGASSDFYDAMTDGSTTATASGGDTFKFRSSDSSLNVTVQNNDGTHGDNLNLTVNEANVDHDALSNFVANEHVDHSAVTLTAGSGLSGGGDITASRSFAVNVDDSTIEINSDTLRVKDSGIATAKIADAAVTLAKMANLATDRLIGRDTAGTGVPEALTVGGGVEFSGSGGIQRSALTGDVTASAGSGSTTIANNAVTTAKIADDNVTYAKIQDVSATDKLLGRVTAGAGIIEEVTCTDFAQSLLDDAAASDARTTLGLGTVATESTVPIAKGGTGQTSQTAAFDALAPTTTKGDIIVSNGSDNIRLPVGTNTHVLTADSGEASGVKWAAPTGGLSNGYDEITDGTTTAAASGGDTFKLRSASNLLTVAVQSNDATHGDNALFTVNQGNIDHGSIAGLSGDHHTQYLKTDGSRAWTGHQLLGADTRRFERSAGVSVGFEINSGTLSANYIAVTAANASSHPAVSAEGADTNVDLLLESKGSGVVKANGTQVATTDMLTAGTITYTPAVSTDWDGDADPGDVDNALDQLAERVDDLEASPGGGDVNGPGSSTDNAIATWDGTGGDTLQNTDLTYASGTLDRPGAELSIGHSGANVALDDAVHLEFGTSTGTKIGTSTSQKLGFYNATPVAQQANTTDLKDCLTTLGLLASGGATPLNLDGGDLTCDDIACDDVSCGTITVADGDNVVLNTTTGTKIGTSASQKLAFFNATPIVQPANTTDLKDAIVNLGLLASGGATPLNLDGGDFTCDDITADDVVADTIELTGGTGHAAIRLASVAAPSSPVEGDAWNDSTLKMIQHFAGGLKQSLSGTAYTATASATVGNTSSETTIIGSGVGTLTFPANFWTPGKSLRITAWGTLTTNTANTGFTIRTKLNGSTITSTSSSLTVSISSQAWKWEQLWTCRTTGASGAFAGHSMFHHGISAVNAVTWWIANSIGTVDTTASMTPDITVQWTTPSVNNTITCTNLIAEVV